MNDGSEGESGETGGAATADAAADAAIEGQYTVMSNRLLRGDLTKVVTEMEKNKMKKDVYNIDLKNIQKFSTIVNNHKLETDVMYHEEMGGDNSDHDVLSDGVTGGGDDHVEKEEEEKGETGSESSENEMKFKRRKTKIKKTISTGTALNPYAQFTSEGD